MRAVRARAESAALCVLAAFALAVSGCATRQTTVSTSAAGYSVARSATASETSAAASESLALVKALASRDESQARLAAGEAVDLAQWRDEAFGPYSQGDVTVISLETTSVQVDSSSPPPVWMSSARLVITAAGQQHEFPVYLIGMVDGGAMHAQEVSRSRFH